MTEEPRQILALLQPLDSPMPEVLPLGHFRDKNPLFYFFGFKSIS